MAQQNQSLQEHYAPKSICFGCGPANMQGLKIRSFAKEKEVVAEFTPQKFHDAFPGVLNGGIIGTLLDCHMNWTAAWNLMKKNNSEAPPCTVTAEFSVQLKRPTPTPGTLEIHAQAIEVQEDRAIIEGKIIANGKVCATGRGIFVAVKEGHPAFHRW